MSKVIPIGQASPERALEGLNRLTGLVFDQWPESLVNPGKKPLPQQNEKGQETIRPPALVIGSITQRIGNG
ncbi:MAG: hypothetical protein ACK4SX_02780 [Alcanivoracaceae bacterium]